MSADVIARGIAAQARGAQLLRDAPGPRTGGTTPLVRQLARTAAMIARVRAGTGSGAIALLGDSTTFGVGASARTQDYAHRLAAILTAAGVPAETDSLWGNPSGVSLGSYDSRFTYGSFGGNTVSIGGSMFSDTSGTSPLTFTPEKPVNAAEVWYPVDPQFGSVAVAVDGGATQTVGLSSGGGAWAWNGAAWTLTSAPVATANGFGRATFTIAATGTHTLSVARVGGNVKIAGIHGYRTDLRQVAIYDWGRPGETSVGWAAGTSSWNYRGVAGTVLKPDLTIVDLGINDANTGVTPSTFAAAIQQLLAVSIGNARDTALIVPVPSGTSTIPLATQTAIRAQIEALAAANALPILADLPQRWGEYAGGNALGYYGSGETVHPGDAGYADKAQAVARVLLGL